MAKRGRKPKRVQADKTLAGTPEAKTGKGAAPRLLPLKSDVVFKMVFGDRRYIRIITDVTEVHTFELKKLPENAGEDEKEGELLDWLRLIRSEREEEIEMLAVKTKEMKMAVSRLRQVSADERSRRLFEARQFYLMDEMARREEAVAEGEARGRVEGKLEMVKDMLLDGVDIEVISRISRMSPEEIKNLK